VSAIVAEK